MTSKVKHLSLLYEGPLVAPDTAAPRIDAPWLTIEIGTINSSHILRNEEIIYFQRLGITFFFSFHNFYFERLIG